MTWGPEDWDGWLRRTQSEDAYSDPSHVRAMREILSKIPGRAQKIAFAVNCEEHAYLLHGFADVSAASSHDRSGGKYDVALAVDPVGRSESDTVDRAVAFAHDGLVEGGIFVASFPATNRKEPVALSIGTTAAALQNPGSHRIHEVELQYRLRRAGFQGVRIRRFPAVAEEGDTLVCMAVRRASN